METLTAAQWRSNTQALIDMAGSGALVPRIPNLPLELLRNALEHVGTPEHEVSSAFDAALEDAGSYAELARRVGVSDEYIRQIATGSRPPRGKLLAFIGYEATVTYRRATPSDASQADSKSGEAS